MKPNRILDKGKQIFLRPTNTIPFMMGLFVGLMVANPDLLQNLSLTALSGGAFHVTKAVFSIHA